MSDAPPLLDGIKVVDFSQFLAGPFCSLRLLDFGAEVLKVENPDGGDLCRRLYLSDTKLGADSTLFHAINRGKKSIALDLKSTPDIARVKQLISDADVVIQNFRPGVIERLGLDYDTVKSLNPSVVYGSVSGYGTDNPWDALPGQDLLAQARSGIMWLSGNSASGPVPVGLPIADMLAGANLAQGLLAALVRKARLGLGAHIETSLLEAMVDVQFEYLTTYLNNGQVPPKRLETGSAHGYLAAPYGVFETQDGHLALAMGDLEKLARLLALPELTALCKTHGARAGFCERDTVQSMIADRLRMERVDPLEETLTKQGLWCAKVLDWQAFLASQAFQKLNMVATSPDAPYQFLRAPLRIDGERPQVHGPGPELPQRQQ